MRAAAEFADPAHLRRRPRDRHDPDRSSPPTAARRPRPRRRRWRCPVRVRTVRPARRAWQPSRAHCLSRRAERCARALRRGRRPAAALARRAGRGRARRPQPGVRPAAPRAHRPAHRAARRATVGGVASGRARPSRPAARARLRPGHHPRRPHLDSRARRARGELLTLRFGDGEVDATVDGAGGSPPPPVERKPRKSYIAPQPGLFDPPEE